MHTNTLLLSYIIISQIYIRKTGLTSNRDKETQGRVGNERDTNTNVQNNSNINQGRPGQRGIRPSEKSSQSNLNDRSGRRDNNPFQNISKERPSKNEQNPYQENLENVLEKYGITILNQKCYYKFTMN